MARHNYTQRRLRSPLPPACLTAGVLAVTWLGAMPCSHAEPEVVRNRWELAWSDEFNRNGLPDPRAWSLCERGKVDWNDTMTNDPRAAVVNNGCLRLRGWVETRDGTTTYLTGGVQSKGKLAFKHGKVEIRARFKSARGAWPALWMLGEQGGWPGNGEIDLMEHLNFDEIVYQTVHSKYTQQQGGTQNPKSGRTAKIERDQFNIYGVEWDGESIVFTVNGKPTHTYPRVAAKGPDQWPFDQPFYFIFSMQIGGSWVGKPDAEDYPAGMEVDWVRVYQKT